MELTQYTDYSLRTLIYVSLNPQKRCSISEIADAYSISENHLTKVVHGLSKLGYIKTYRGRGGGIGPALEPHQIVIGEVVRQTENTAVLECLKESGSASCCLTEICLLKSALARATEAFLAELDRYTLADLIQNRPALLQRLAPEK